MKKSLINMAISIAFTGAVFSGSVLSTQAFADDLAIDNNTNNEGTSENYMYPGMGVGAATGTLIAGPIGLLVGGFVGALVGSTQPSENGTNAIAVTDNYSASDEDASVAASSESNHSDLTNLQVAQLGPINTVIEKSIDPQNDDVINILTADLSLDVYFRSGSTDIESFYPARLTAIANLLKEIDQLELHLDGYTDRRGDKSQNIALANKRIDNVRQQLINAGVDENRIISKAFGEMKMVSNAGDLEGYTYDRKVVIRFERSSADSIHAMTAALSETIPAETETDESVSSINDESTDPAVANATTRF